MRATLSHLAALVLAGLVAFPASALDIGAAMPAAEVKMKNVDGKEVTIANVKGEKGTLVIFTCNACPWVKAWEERYVAIGNAAGAMGIGVIAINSNDPTKVADDGYDEMKKRAAERKMAFPYVVDATSNVARAFGATRTPEIFLFDASGKLVYHGAVDDNGKDATAVTSHWLKDAVGAVATGKAISTPETKAFGCTIKFRPEV